ncbi:MAG: hypothetical protein ACHP7E_09145, partial [Burkholderiales bacterium]
MTKKFVFASILLASLSVSGLALAQDPAARKPTKPVSVKKVHAAAHHQAVEEATPTEDYDPTDKLTPEE